MKLKEAARKFSRTARFDGFTEDKHAHVVAWARLPESLVLYTAREAVAILHQRWTREKGHLPFHDDAVSAVEAHLRKVPIV